MTVEVEEMSPEEGRAMFERACQEALGIGAIEFMEHYDWGTHESLADHETITGLVMLIPFWR
jgi:hypothetical protein